MSNPITNRMLFVNYSKIDNIPNQANKKQKQFYTSVPLYSALKSGEYNALNKILLCHLLRCFMKSMKQNGDCSSTIA